MKKISLCLTIFWDASFIVACRKNDVINNTRRTSKSCDLFANESHFLRYDQFLTWSPSSRYIATTHGLSVTSIEFRMRRRKGREAGRGKRWASIAKEDLRNGSCAHDRMRVVSLHASGRSRVEPRFWAPARGPWPLMRSRRKREWTRREKKSFAGHGKGRREIKREREETGPASFADWRAPESLRCARETEQ